VAVAEVIYPHAFSAHPQSGGAETYLRDPSVGKLVDFFQAKGLRALKDEHRLYASVLSPRQFSSLGFEFDLLRLTRFLEVFAYFSPAHGYSLQVTFLGLFS